MNCRLLEKVEHFLRIEIKARNKFIILQYVMIRDYSKGLSGHYKG